MTQCAIDETITALTEESPSYERLMKLYQSLQNIDNDGAERTVCKRALAHLVGDILDYLDYVSDNFEKTVGLTREKERKRVLAELEKPTGGTFIEQTDSLIKQWHAIETFGEEIFDENVTHL